MKFDFGGYATKCNMRCSDGVTIRKGAFKDCDGNIVPVVWQHLHDDPSNILGKAFLEHRDDGVYAYVALNDTEKAHTVKELLRHGDINSMSIYATKIEKIGSDVVHGDIKEVSLVLAPANPGARIEELSLSHGDGSISTIDNEFILRQSGEIDEYSAFDLPIDVYNPDGTLAHADDEDDEDEDADDETIEDVFNTLNEKQKNAVYAIVGAAVMQAEEEAEGKAKPKAVTTTKKTTTIKQSEGGTQMTFNAFEGRKASPTEKTLSHSEIESIAKATFDECRRTNCSFRNALKHAVSDYGITNIDVLFPDATTLGNEPKLVKRKTEWVAKVLDGTSHTPFSRVKSIFADITEDEARARGYIKGSQKVEEVFPVMQRITTPQTIYKKQKLDRDDILDISTFDVVSWLRSEMRIMLEEELARAILIGDGRLVSSPDKIKEDHIRPIWTDEDFYSSKIQLPADAAMDDLADAFIKSRLSYEGSGRPVTFMAPETVTDLMLQRDKDGRRLYKTEQELADALRVSAIVEVPLFYGQTRKVGDKTYALDAIIVNLADYTVGADKGGEVNTFDDFDIDYNQYKYLIETRVSGALTGYHSAVVIEREVAVLA